jgi:3-oxoacyl-[acyl-carrier protein] reductase
MSMTIDLSGRKALVTGGSRGIGAAVARALFQAGAKVAINVPSRQDDPAHQEARLLLIELDSLRHGDALVLEADVANAAEVETMMGTFRDHWGALDILVNNAGILRDRSAVKMELADWQAVLDVNLSGVFHCCKYGLGIMADGGVIVNVSSLSARMGFHGQANYAASKAGVAALTRVLARESAGRGIRVAAVAPGVIETAMIAQVSDRARADLARSIALKRLGQPTEVASVILFLCSPLASYVTGTIVEVDGGYF